MSFSTYAGLKTAIANNANRSDLTSVIPDFVALAETRIFYGSEEQPFATPPLRIRAMEYPADVTISGQTASLPTSFLQARRLYLNSNPVQIINYINPDQYWRTYLSTASGKPTRYTIEGENLVFGPTPDTTYTGKILYYKKFDALSSDSDTNWLLTNAPGAYLHGALIELYDYVKDFEAKANAHKAFAGVINGLNTADKQDRFSGPWTAWTDTGNP